MLNDYYKKTDESTKRENIYTIYMSMYVFYLNKKKINIYFFFFLGLYTYNFD